MQSLLGTFQRLGSVMHRLGGSACVTYRFRSHESSLTHRNALFTYGPVQATRESQAGVLVVFTVFE
jgi:hypothetical protein